MNLTADDFTTALLSLLPRGRVWPKEPGAVLPNTIAFVSPTFARQTARANNLLVDAFPATAVELLPTWEALLGLPDPCAGQGTTIAARQAQVIARLLGTGGQAVDDLIAFAALFGYTITITEQAPADGTLTPATIGSTIGDRLVEDSGNDVFTYIVNAPLVTVTYATIGSTIGTPLVAWGNDVLECVMEEVKPAHTQVLFAYS